MNFPRFLCQTIFLGLVIENSQFPNFPVFNRTNVHSLSGIIPLALALDSKFGFSAPGLKIIRRGFLAIISLIKLSEISAATYSETVSIESLISLMEGKTGI